MDYLYLPFLTPNETLDAAFDRMFRTDSRAMILDRSNVYALYTNEDVAFALTETDKKTCGELSADQAIPVADLTGQLTYPPGSQLNPQNARSVLEDIFERQFAFHAMDYGIVFPPFPQRPGSAAS